MIPLLLSITNIWPFANRSVSIRFKQWPTLIKAPIGSGKSVLFFDSIVFALYKHANRELVNTSCKTWTIKLAFELQWQQFVIVRQLKKWSKTWWTSQLFTLTGSIDDLLEGQLITFDTDLVDRIDPMLLQQIVYKNESDLKWELGTLLPNRDVFINSVMMMQESENIFDVAQNKRFEILKYLFGFELIDQAKDALSEHKSYLKWQLSGLSNYDYQHSQLAQIWNDIKNHSQQRNSDLQVVERGISAIEFAAELVDYEMLWHIQLEHLTTKIPTWPATIAQVLYEKQAALKAQEEKYQFITNLITGKKDQLVTLEKEFDSLKTILSQAQTNDVGKLDAEIVQVQSGLDAVKKEQEGLNGLLSDIDTEGRTESASLRGQSITWSQVSQMINDRMSEWRQLKAEREAVQSKIDAAVNQTTLLKTQIIDLQAKKISAIADQQQQQKAFHQQLLDRHTQQGQQLIKQLTDAQTQLDQTKQQIAGLRDRFASAAKFHCEKIAWDCPFVTQINTATFEQLSKQIDQMEVTASNQQKSIDDLQLRITEHHSKPPIQEEKQSAIVEQIDQTNTRLTQQLSDITQHWVDTELLESAKTLDQKLEQSRNFFAVNDWKTWQQNAVREQELVQNYHTISHKLMNLQQTRSIAMNEQAKIADAQTRLTLLDQQKQVLNTELTEYVSQQQSLQSVLWTQSQHINQLLSKDTTIRQAIDRLVVLVDNYRESMKQIEVVKQESELTNTLFNVVSKELMVQVLQTKLPLIEMIMNNFLAHVTNYQLKFDINPAGDTLDILIHEDWAYRDVATLSGGQRTLLRLSWILAIATINNNKFLFLDETINHLDAETVWKVAALIESFVMKNDISLYLVTHSQEIQMMNIWKNTAEVKRD